MPKQVLPLTGSLYFKTTTLILWWKAVRHTWQMRLNGNINTKNRWETYHKIPYRGGRFIIESKNNRYTVVANLGYLQRQFKNHYYLSSATNSTFLWILVFIFFLSFFVLPWGQSDDWHTVTSMFCVAIGTLRSNDADGNENVKKTQVLEAKQ